MYIRDTWAQGIYFSSTKETIAFGFALLCFCFGFVQAYITIRQLPRLTFTEKGLEYAHLRGKPKFWAWKDVGPFRYETMSFGKGSAHVLCAFHDLTHDTFERFGQAAPPNLFTAEIILNIHPFKGFGSARLKEMEAEANRWREEFGSPGNDAVSLAPDQLKQRLSNIDRKEQKQKIMIAVAVIAAPLIIVGCKLILT